MLNTILIIKNAAISIPNIIDANIITPNGISEN
jgi:hypothetical protein